MSAKSDEWILLNGVISSRCRENNVTKVSSISYTCSLQNYISDSWTTCVEFFCFNWPVRYFALSNNDIIIVVLCQIGHSCPNCAMQQLVLISILYIPRKGIELKAQHVCRGLFCKYCSAIIVSSTIWGRCSSRTFFRTSQIIVPSTKCGNTI